MHCKFIYLETIETTYTSQQGNPRILVALNKVLFVAPKTFKAQTLNHTHCLKLNEQTYMKYSMILWATEKYI